ncbi:MAG: hypothetical protein CMQ38_12965 [Gammaproteobacteria bacterium]|nr:hypothetical protein [Gammaproteobacteria bacterium]
MPNYGIYSKLLKFDRTPEEANDAAHDQAIEEAVAGLEVLPKGSILNESKKINNTWTLGGGVYPSFTHDAKENVIRGVAANSIIARRCQFNAHASVFGVTFTDSMELDATELVRIGPGAAVSFVNCIFRRSPESTSSLVYVSNQGAGLVDPAVAFVGCTFINGGTTTIDNQTGSALKVQAIGCVNLTPNASLGSITETGTVKVA